MLVATQIKLLEPDLKWVRCVHLCSMQHVTRRVTSCYINVTSYAACGKARHIIVTSRCAMIWCVNLTHHISNQCQDCSMSQINVPLKNSKRLLLHQSRPQLILDRWGSSFKTRLDFILRLNRKLSHTKLDRPNQIISSCQSRLSAFHICLLFTSVCFLHLSAFHICLLFTFWVHCKRMNSSYPSMWAVLKNHSPKLKVGQLVIIQACLCFKQFCCNQFETAGVI